MTSNCYKIFQILNHNLCTHCSLVIVCTIDSKSRVRTLCNSVVAQVSLQGCSQVVCHLKDGFQGTGCGLLPALRAHLSKHSVPVLHRSHRWHIPFLYKPP